MIIEDLKRAAEQPDDGFGITIVVPKGESLRPLHVRGKLLSVNQNGDRIYRITPKQARKVVRLYYKALAESTL